MGVLKKREREKTAKKFNLEQIDPSKMQPLPGPTVETPAERELGPEYPIPPTKRR